ncbi:MAG: tetratricopeptide repeat protein [Gemmatimonadales bacterium]|nr:tetratricopeptide repeat protein [Gemmatimonadales bacterium]
MNRLKQFITEIHRRSLWQVLLIYVGGAWVCYEIIDTITDRLALPEWLPVLAIILFLIGLPVVLATAFVGEVEAPSRAPTKAEPAAVHHEATRRHRFLTRRNAGATFVTVLAAWGVVATGWMLFGRGADEGATADERPSVAVLPLENRSGLEEDRYFTDGIHDEILTQLSKISGLSVRGRTSVMEYRDSPKNLRQIGEELNARYLMEGGVQRAGETVRINVQLIDAETDEHVFVDTYDRELSVENLLAVQREVALRIADALEATLTPAERERIEARPTDNLEAYEFYLRGMEYWRRPGWLAGDYRSAQRMWEHAVELDPGFALAHAWLSIIHSHIYWFRYDFTEERLRLARAAADRALELDPSLPEGHLALGYYYYYGFRAYDQALEELAVAEQGLPGDAEVLEARGLIYRRQGKWEEAIANLQRAADLDPRHATRLAELGDTHRFLRRYDEAERYYDRALTIEPEYEEAAYSRAEIGLLRDGDLEPLRAYVSAHLDAHLVRRRLEVLNRDYPAALAALSQVEDEIIEGQYAYDPKSLYSGLTHLYAGQTDLARAAFDSARVILEPAVAERPDDYRRRVSLGLAYAGLGMKQAAVREGQMAVDLLPMSKDAFFAPGPLIGLAQVYTLVGDYDAAIDLLDYLLSIPSSMSVPGLRLSPIYDPLRDHPRFQALLERYE